MGGDYVTVIVYYLNVSEDILCHVLDDKLLGFESAIGNTLEVFSTILLSFRRRRRIPAGHGVPHHCSQDCQQHHYQEHQEVDRQDGPL